MATPLANLVSSLNVSLQVASQKAGNLQSPTANLVAAKALATILGTGAIGKCDLLFNDRRLIAASQDDELKLTATLKNDFGDTLTFANVKLILIYNRTDEAWSTHTATTAVVTIGGGTHEFQGPFGAAADKLSLPTGGIFLATSPTAAGWTVTVDTADDLLVHNDDAGNEAMYDVVLLGEST